MEKIHYPRCLHQPSFLAVGLPKASVVTLQNPPHFEAPASLFDLVNFSVSEFIGVSGALVTRICEGEFGITREEWQFIAMLAHLGEISPSELASATTIDRSQTSKSLRGLIEKGLVYRRVLPSDRRRAMVGVTSQGEQIYQRIFPRVLEVHHEVLKGFSEADKATLSRCVYNMHKNASKAFNALLQGSRADRRRGQQLPLPPQK
jgi:DNA-binding MarR family transcriptional regulator